MSTPISNVAGDAVRRTYKLLNALPADSPLGIEWRALVREVIQTSDLHADSDALAKRTIDLCERVEAAAAGEKP